MDYSSVIQVRRVLAGVAATTTTQVSSAVDMMGFQSVIFLASVGTAATNNILSVESSADGSTNWAAITGSAVTPGATDKFQWAEVVRPQARYVRASVALGASSTVENILALCLGPTTAPVGNATAGTVAGVLKIAG